MGNLMQESSRSKNANRFESAHQKSALIDRPDQSRVGVIQTLAPIVNRKMLPLCICLVLVSMTPLSAEALVMESKSFTVSETYSLNGVPVPPVTDSGILSAEIGATTVQGTGLDSVFYHVYGFDNIGAIIFGSRSSGSGVFTANGTMTFTDVISNPVTDPSTPLSFTFALSDGELAVRCSPGVNSTAGCLGGGSASYTVNIKIEKDTTTGFTPVPGGQSSATLTMPATGVPTLTRTGFIPNGASAFLVNTPPPVVPPSTSPGVDALYSWGNTTTTLNLGTIDPGQTWTLHYDLISMATGAFSPAGLVSCDPVSGICASPPNVVGTSLARIADPSGLGPISPGVRVVPEPSTLALLTAACIGFVTRQRRRL